MCEIMASAPGSLMLLGEHAVLHGARALVCAIDRRITVRLISGDDGMVRIDSALGQYESALDDLRDEHTFRFVLQAIRQHLGKIPCGFTLKIDSEFSADIGFGSSAAVTVAVHAALMKFCGVKFDRRALFDCALKTVHSVQGRGSGADLAASVFGGVVAYSTKPSFESVPVSLPLTAVYCGYKTPTPEVIQKVEALRAEDPQKYAGIYAEMDQCAGRAVDLLKKTDFGGFGQILNRNQELMDEMGVNTPELQEIVAALQANPEISGAKISGSGMGDCAIGIGRLAQESFPYPTYSLSISPNGSESFRTSRGSYQ